MVEQEAVNFEVAGSSPASGAKPYKIKSELLIQFWLFDTQARAETRF